MRRISETVSDVLETWEGQNIFSVKWQNNKNKNKTKQTKNPTDPHKESRAKKEKGKDHEHLQDMCKNHQGLQHKKKELAKRIICGLQ